MKQLLLAGVSLFAFATASASAADLPRRAGPPAPVPYFAPVYNWTGFYLGINGGGGFGSSEWTNAIASSGNFDVSGGLVGGTVGYNWQMPNNIVLGLEGDIDWSNIKGSTACGGTSCETRNEWLSTVRGRVGYAFDRFMPYVTGGLAIGDVKAEAPGFAGGTTETKAGWTLGGGLEVAIAGPWTAKVEYLYVDLGKTNCDASACGISTDVDFHTSIVRAGVNYRF